MDSEPELVFLQDGCEVWSCVWCGHVHPVAMPPLHLRLGNRVIAFLCDQHALTESGESLGNPCESFMHAALRDWFSGLAADGPPIAAQPELELVELAELAEHEPELVELAEQRMDDGPKNESGEG